MHDVCLTITKQMKRTTKERQTETKNG